MNFVSDFFVLSRIVDNLNPSGMLLVGQTSGGQDLQGIFKHCVAQVSVCLFSLILYYLSSLLSHAR